MSDIVERLRELAGYKYQSSSGRLNGGKMSKPELPPLSEPDAGLGVHLFTFGRHAARAYGLACYRAGRAEGQAERDALKADAERYRWLRDVGDDTWTPLIKRTFGWNPDVAIDAAIDAARKQDD